jgi:hypothetical protein
MKKELFESMVDDPRILFQAYLEDPEHFEEGTGDLLQRLLNGGRLEDFTRAERDVLNRATIDFATAKRPTPKRSPPPAREPAAIRAAEHELDEAGRRTAVLPEELLADAPPTFWWRR